MNILKLISSDSYIVVNKHLVRELGTDAAILLGHLSSCQNYHGDWFFQTYERIEDETGIKRHTARVAMKSMIDIGILSSKREGIPCRTFYSIDTFKLQVLLNNDDKSDENVMTSATGIERQELSESNDINKNTEIRIKNKNKSINSNSDFESFYSVYPKHVSKGQALKTWTKMSKDKQLPDISVIISAIQKWKDTDVFKNTDSKFIKNPSTWLNGLCWDDEIDTKPVINNNKPISNFDRGRLIIEE
jgi:hypothetical protein